MEVGTCSAFCNKLWLHRRLSRVSYQESSGFKPRCAGFLHCSRTFSLSQNFNKFPSKFPRERAAVKATEDFPRVSKTGVDLQNVHVEAIALSNLCVDIILSVRNLPHEFSEERKNLLKQLTSSNTDNMTWEVGGCCNFLIAAARLGLRCASVGHASADRYGKFINQVLKSEGVLAVENILPAEAERALGTLLCFVLVDPEGRHAFCSSYDFGPWPLLGDVRALPGPAAQILRETRAVYVNGFCFDEMSADLVVESVAASEAAGAAVFFDPGPRCWTMLEGDRRAAMDAVLRHATGVLVTLEEGKAITGRDTPEGIAASLRSKGNEQIEWVVVKNGAEGAALVTKDRVFHSPAFEVPVCDTVGCGDSFAAAVILGYIREAGVGATLALANAVGAATATRRGAGRNVGDLRTVRSLLEASGGPDAAAALALCGSLPADVRHRGD